MDRFDKHNLDVNDKPVTNVRRRSTIYVDDLERKRSRVNSSVAVENAPCHPVTAPPDGGYGYVIVFAAFLSNFIVDGIFYSFAILKDSIIKDFKSQPSAISQSIDNATVAWIGSILTGFYAGMGPFVSAAANKFGFRIVAVTGSIITSLGFVLASYFSLNGANMTYLCVFYGVFGGIGFSCISIPAVIAVGFYFEKKRAFATGIAVCGTGVGAFVFPPLIDHFIYQWQWQGAILALGLLVLGCSLLGLLYKPLEEPLKDIPKNPLQATVITQMHKSRRGPRQVKISFIPENGRGETPLYSRLINLLRSATNRKDTTDPEITHFTFDKPVHKDDSFNPANFFVLPDVTKNVTTTHSELPAADDISSVTRKLPCGVGLWRKLSVLFDFSLLSSPTFLMLAFSNFFAVMGLLVPFVYFMDQALSALTEGASAPEKSAITLLLSQIGAANTVGRIVSGWLADRPFISALVLNNIALTLMGVSTGIVPFLKQYYQFVIFSWAFGLSLACYISLRPILLVEFLGISRLTNAFGLLMLFIGISAIVATPMAGRIATIGDNAHDFSYAFYFAGGCLLFSAVICYPLNVVKKWQST